MKTLQEIIHTALPKFSLLIELIKKPMLAFFVITPTVPTAIVVDIVSASYLLGYLFIGDLVSGILASYFVWKKSDRKDKWFFGKGEGFSSDKFKKMFVKLMVYTGTPLLINKFQSTFLIKNISYKSISDAEIDIATFLILLFILNEGYSIFHENLPKCGFNLWERAKKLYQAIIKIKSAIKEIKE